MARRIVAARVTKKPGVAGRMRPMLILLGWGRKLNERLWVMGMHYIFWQALPLLCFFR